MTGARNLVLAAVCVALRSEEHTSELQSRENLVCRLLLETKKSTSDGYTIQMTTTSNVVNPSLYKKIPYYVDTNFILVTKAGANPNSWIVNFFFFNDTATTEIYTLSLHDALPILLSFAAQTGSMVSGEMTRYLERE